MLIQWELGRATLNMLPQLAANFDARWIEL